MAYDERKDSAHSLQSHYYAGQLILAKGASPDEDQIENRQIINGHAVTQVDRTGVI